MSWQYSLAALGLLGACVSVDHDHADRGSDTALPPPGSNLILRGPITISDDLEVIISDVVIPAGATVPRHFHPGEEFVYVISGSAIHVEAGKDDQILRAGDAHVIPPKPKQQNSLPQLRHGRKHALKRAPQPMPHTGPDRHHRAPDQELIQQSLACPAVHAGL